MTIECWTCKDCSKPIGECICQPAYIITHIGLVTENGVFVSDVAIAPESNEAARIRASWNC